MKRNVNIWEHEERMHSIVCEPGFMHIFALSYHKSYQFIFKNNFLLLNNYARKSVTQLFVFDRIRWLTILRRAAALSSCSLATKEFFIHENMNVISYTYITCTYLQKARKETTSFANIN